jgi:hypothetical protein
MKAFFAKILGITQSIWNFYAPLLRSLAITGTGILLPIALEIVRSLATTDKSSAEKREEAVSALKGAALKQGVTFTESLIRFTVESAVQRMRLDEK